MKKIERCIAIFTALLLAAGSAAFAKETKTRTQKASAGTVVVIGTEGTVAPLSYVDKNGRLTGFEVEVARAIDEKLDDVSFRFELTEWDSIFLALETGKIDAIANQIGRTPEREARYLFADEPYWYSTTAVLFRKERHDIHSIKDLEGKKVLCNYVSSYTDYLREYNRTHGDRIELGYIEGVADIFYTEIALGHYDATIGDPPSFDEYINNRSLPLAYEILPDYPTRTIHIVLANNKKGRELKPKIDAALRELRADGTLSRLSLQFLGKDYTVPPSQN